MDSALTESAQTYATYLAQNDKFEHAPSGDREGQGENLYKACSSGDSPSGDAATDEWLVFQVIDTRVDNIVYTLFVRYTCQYFRIRMRLVFSLSL